MSKSSYFEKFISPISEKEFFDTFYEKKPMLISNKDKDRFKSLLSVQDFEYLLFSLTSPSIAWLRIANNKEEYNSDYYVDDVGRYKIVNQERVLEGFKNGDTLTLNSLEKRWDPIKGLCFNLTKFFHHPVRANAYYSPANCQGFQAHVDAEEVFILQISGEKLWKLYANPLEFHVKNYDLRHPKPLFNHDKHPFQEVILKPGDLLYIPRGCGHEAVATHHPSLHLTVGVYVKTYIDLLNELSFYEPSLRQALPPGLDSFDFGKIISNLKNKKAVRQALKSLREEVFLENESASFQLTKTTPKPHRS